MLFFLALKKKYVYVQEEKAERERCICFEKAHLGNTETEVIEFLGELKNHTFVEIGSDNRGLVHSFTWLISGCTLD